MKQSHIYLFKRKCVINLQLADQDSPIREEHLFNRLKTFRQTSLKMINVLIKVVNLIERAEHEHVLRDCQLECSHYNSLCLITKTLVSFSAAGDEMRLSVRVRFGQLAFTDVLLLIVELGEGMVDEGGLGVLEGTGLVFERGVD